MSGEKEDKPQARRKYLQKTSDKELLSKICKEFLKFNNTTRFKKQVKDLNRHFSKKDKVNILKRCSTSLFGNKTQVFRQKIEMWKLYIHYSELDSFPILKYVSDEMCGNSNEYDFLNPV